MLARYGYRPILLERGMDVERRQNAVERFWKTGEFQPDTNVQFGEGGAGYAGGITSAAMDGLRIAEAIRKVYSPTEKTEK